MASRFMTIEQQQLWIEAAINLTSIRISNGGNKELYNYIQNQLDYINSCLNDKSYPRDKLSDINIGQLAVREFEGVDDEFAQALKRVYFITHYMMEGLKVPLLDDNGNIF